MIMFIFVILVVLLSCEEKGWFVKCEDCLPDEPKSANLNIKLSQPQVPILVKIYEGKLEDSVLYHSDLTTWSDYTIDVPLNKKYAVTATYIIGDKKYVAVSSADPRVKYAEDQCDEPCYYVYGTDVNLRIKYTGKGE